MHLLIQKVADNTLILSSTNYTDLLKTRHTSPQNMHKHTQTHRRKCKDELVRGWRRRVPRVWAGDPVHRVSGEGPVRSLVRPLHVRGERRVWPALGGFPHHPLAAVLRLVRRHVAGQPARRPRRHLFVLLLGHLFMALWGRWGGGRRTSLHMVRYGKGCYHTNDSLRSSILVYLKQKIK